MKESRHEIKAWSILLHLYSGAPFRCIRQRRHVKESKDKEKQTSQGEHYMDNGHNKEGWGLDMSCNN